MKSNNLCLNCLRPRYFVKRCTSVHCCRRCQKPHHTLLHVENERSPPSASAAPVKPITSHTATGLTPNSLLMTCRVSVESPGGSAIEARAILDSASSASFVSEQLTQTLCLTRSRQNTRISGIAGLSRNSPFQSIASFKISPSRHPNKKFEVSAVVVPRVTCDLPLQAVSFDSSWKHLDDLTLANPDFGCPGRIDTLLGVDVFVETLLHSRGGLGLLAPVHLRLSLVGSLQVI